MEQNINTDVSIAPYLPSYLLATVACFARGHIKFMNLLVTFLCTYIPLHIIKINKLCHKNMASNYTVFFSGSKLHDDFWFNKVIKLKFTRFFIGLENVCEKIRSGCSIRIPFRQSSPTYQCQTF